MNIFPCVEQDNSSLYWKIVLSHYQPFSRIVEFFRFYIHDIFNILRMIHISNDSRQLNDWNVWRTIHNTRPFYIRSGKTDADHRVAVYTSWKSVSFVQSSTLFPDSNSIFRLPEILPETPQVWYWRATC